MKIVIATPLYPPDIADPAPYVKELARRLSREHEVVVVAYGRLPEQVPGVTILTVDKRLPAQLRLLRFTQRLTRALKGADVLYLQSGVSAELPALLALRLRPTKLLFRQSTDLALKSGLRKHIRRMILRRATAIPNDPALVRPEILPFAPYPTDALAAYESAWTAHLALLGL